MYRSVITMNGIVAKDITTTAAENGGSVFIRNPSAAANSTPVAQPRMRRGILLGKDPVCGRT